MDEGPSPMHQKMSHEPERRSLRRFGFVFLSFVALAVLFPREGPAQTGTYGMLSGGHYSGLGVGYGTRPSRAAA